MRLRELEQTLKKVSERVENIPGAARVNGTGSQSNHTRQGSQTRVPTPSCSITGTKRTADVLSDSGSASEIIDTDRLRRRRRSTHGTSSLQSYVTGDGKKAHHFFGATSEMVFLDNVREYVQQLGYELPSSRALWSPSLETIRQDAVQSNLSAELRSQLPPQPLGTKLLEVYRNSVQAHTPMLYWPSILIKFQRIYTGSPVHYEHDQIVADFSILMMVWAVGAQMSDLAEVRHNSGRQMKNGWEFFEAAVPLLHLSPPTVCVNSSMYDLSHNNDIAGINTDAPAVCEEGGPSPDYLNFDSSDIRWDMLKGLLNVESQFGMYLGGSILESGEGEDMRADF
ncbi:hypothetical protein VE04_00926 [Pseudogymnoascus sp. 24MN13]|nr:hypothetical protein VE04_00926 [Pseudogymnoascus sp. 24MN13]